MAQLRNSILATLIYYDIINLALTPLDVFNYLINPSRLSFGNKPVKDFSFHDVWIELENLAKLKLIGHKNGYYFLRERDELFDLRIERMKIADQKWMKFLKAVQWIQLVPYIRGVFASGSLAMSNTDNKSDFDVLMIVQSRRLYTTRLLLLSLTSLLRSRRRWFDKTAPNKLCFNHYLVQDQLHIRHHSIFNAQSYAHLIPVLAPRELFDRFYYENKWINKYLFNFRPAYEYLRRSVKKNYFFIVAARILEFILNSKIGDSFEYLAKKYQHNRIKNNPNTYSSGGRVVFSDFELEFHPNSFEKFLIEKYNLSLKKFGIIVRLEEKDSGLS